MSIGLKKFIVEYDLPYRHIVRVGIEADSPEQAGKIAECRFKDATLWDNTPSFPLLYDEFDEEGDSGETLDFTIRAEVESWPEPDSSVKQLMRDNLAHEVCAALVARESSGVIDEWLLPLIEMAKRASGRPHPHEAMQSTEASLPNSHGTPAQVVVCVQDGVVQSVSSDTRRVSLVVLDFDVEGADMGDLVEVDVAESDGSIRVEEVFRFGSWSASFDPTWVEQIHVQAASCE